MAAKWSATRGSGVRIAGKGYIAIKAPEHPRAARGYVLEHIVVAEKALGHFLPDEAEIHHVNAVRSDNRPGNIVICQDHQYHMLLHARLRVIRRGGNPNRDKICGKCGEVKPRTDFHPAPSMAGGLYSRCRRCHAAAARKERLA